MYPAHAPEKSDGIDGALGDGSRFHESFGFYAHVSARKRPRRRTDGRSVLCASSSARA